MLRTLKNLFKQDREKFVVPKSVQNVIPIKTIWEDGIFLVGRNKYAKTFKFEDINYAVASREDKEAMFLEYSELLNSLDSGATTKITINNRRLNKADFEQTILIPMADDGLDKYRKEYNKMLRREKYLEERDAEFMAQSTDYDRVLEAIPDPASLPINLLAEENRRRKDARLDYLPIALEKLRLDFPEGYNVIIDYFYCTEKVTLTELATRYGTTIDIVRYKITIAKKKLKEYIILHENNG